MIKSGRGQPHCNWMKGLMDHGRARGRGRERHRPLITAATNWSWMKHQPTTQRKKRRMDGQQSNDRLASDARTAANAVCTHAMHCTVVMINWADGACSDRRCQPSLWLTPSSFTTTAVHRRGEAHLISPAVSHMHDLGISLRRCMSPWCPTQRRSNLQGRHSS